MDSRVLFYNTIIVDVTLGRRFGYSRDSIDRNSTYKYYLTNTSKNYTVNVSLLVVFSCFKKYNRCDIK